jgi:hypothetical protein
MKLVRILPIAIATALAMPTVAQQPATPAAAPTAPAAAGPTSNMEILRQKLMADKRLVVSENMKLTEAQGKAFWPLYDEYQAELLKINLRLFDGIALYAQDYQKGALSNESAKKLMSEALAIEAAEAGMRKKMAPKLEKAIGAAPTMRYLQIENKIRAVFRYELAGAIPLAE